MLGVILVRQIIQSMGVYVERSVSRLPGHTPMSTPHSMRSVFRMSSLMSCGPSARTRMPCVANVHMIEHAGDLGSTCCCCVALMHKPCGMDAMCHRLPHSSSSSSSEPLSGRLPMHLQTPCRVAAWRCRAQTDVARTRQANQHLSLLPVHTHVTHND